MSETGQENENTSFRRSCSAFLATQHTLREGASSAFDIFSVKCHAAHKDTSAATAGLLSLLHCPLEPPKQHLYSRSRGPLVDY